MLLKNIAKRLFYGYRANSEVYANHLRNIGMLVGSGTIFIDPRTTLIDETRPWLISIGRACCVTGGVTVLTHDFGWSVIKAVYGDVIGSANKVVIGDNVYIGMHSTILAGVHIGNNVIIGANTLVSKSIPDNVVVVGNPARIVRRLDDYYKKRKDSELKEATVMVNEYIKRYHKDPPIEIMREFFWLFENDYDLLIQEFKDVMHLVDGSFDKSCDSLKKHCKKFKNYSSFLDYVKKQKQDDC